MIKDNFYFYAENRARVNNGTSFAAAIVTAFLAVFIPNNNKGTFFHGWPGCPADRTSRGVRLRVVLESIAINRATNPKTAAYGRRLTELKGLAPFRNFYEIFGTITEKPLLKMVN
jgi:hypothetical protein